MASELAAQALGGAETECQGIRRILTPETFQVLDPGQHNPCRLHKQNAQVAIAAPRDLR
jgi:hypothetical protein